MNYCIGEIIAFAGPYVPEGFLPCDGRIVPIDGYEALFVLIGNTYGGDPMHTFGLPNLQGVAVVGMDPSRPDYVYGKAGGQASVALNSTQLPAHNHPVLASNAAATTGAPNNGLLAAATPATAGIYTADTAAAKTQLATNAVAQAGGTDAHNNMMPYLTINYLICTQGIFPRLN